MSKHSATYKRLFSLLGLFPLSVYIFVHLYRNLSSLGGAESFNQVYDQARSAPLIVPIMILLIWVPILFHGTYGLVTMFMQSRPNLIQFPYLENLKYLLQRVSGVGLLLFIPVHIFNSRILPMIEGRPADFDHMTEAFSNPITLTVYVFGILGAAFHVANGVWQFAIGWGVITTTAAMKRMQVVSFLLFFLLLSMGYASLWGFLRA